MERSEQELVRIGKLDTIRQYCNPYPEKYNIASTGEIIISKNNEKNTAQ